MTFRTETDGAGRECIVGQVDSKNVFLVLEHVLHDRANGHGWLTNDARTLLQRLSPIQAEMLKWHNREHAPAEPNIFAGDPT